jgi:hypothetical protein
MGKARRQQAATASRPKTETRPAGNAKRQTGVGVQPRVLRAGKAKMSEMEPGAILEISDEAAQRILDHRTSLQ